MAATTDAATGSGSSRNVLGALDSNVPTSFYWPLTLLATIGGFLFGYDTSNIGSALNFGLRYLVSGASLGAVVEALAAGPMTDHRTGTRRRDDYASCIAARRRPDLERVPA